MSTDNKDEIILEGSEEQSIEAKRNKIDFVTILEESEKEEAHTWHDELAKVKERYDNFDVDKMCARCIREQHEQGVKDVNGNLTTTIQCSGVYSFKNETIAKHGEDIYNAMVNMMSADQLEAAETTVNPLKWMESAITDKKLYSPRSYQKMISSCSAKYKIYRCGRRIGKSYTMSVGMLHRLISRNNYRVLMVAPMETMITEIVELLVKFCNAMEENPITRHTQSPIHHITFNTGSTFKGVTAGASGAKAVRGKGADLLAIDECFPAKTKILMGEGHFKTIDTIKKNERVISFCTETNRFISKPVLEVRCNGKKDVYTYTTVSGKKIHCTDNHPVLTTEGWQPINIAKNIATTKTRTGHYFFESIVDCKFKATEVVYNFEVKDTHSYIADGFIVHNCDFLSPKDFNSILGILIDNKDVELWVSSTPDGESNLYKLSNDSAFKEFHLPSFVIPQYTDEVDKMFKTQLDDVGYNQEVRANFNSTRDGVYPLNFIDQATVKEEVILNKQYILNNRKDCILIMGVDWNHDKVGTRIIIVCYHKLSGRYKIVHRDKVSKEGWTQPLAVEKIINLNREYDCDHIYLDEGFGTPQASQLRLFAQSQFGKVPAMHPDLKLAKVVSVSFGSSMTLQDPVSGEQYTKRTKQFIVENSVDMLTRGLLVLHEVDDIDIIKQMKNYIVKSKSANGSKTYAYKDAQIGDHDLDAYNIALYGFSQEYSVYVNSGPIVGINSLLTQRSIDTQDAVSIVSHSSSMIINTRDSLLKNKFRGNKSSSQFKTRKRW